MHVTRHFGLTNPAIADQVWALYTAGYQRLVGRTVTHEMLYRDEFDAAVGNPSNRLWVLWDDRQPVACTLLATDVGSTGYISREYFEQRYPEFVAEGRVRYLMWIVVHPSYVARGVLLRLAREALGLEAEEGSLLVFDSPEVNQPSDRGGSAELMARVVNATSNGSTVEQIEVQRYFLADFSKGARYRTRADEAVPALSA